MDKQIIYQSTFQEVHVNTSMGIVYQTWLKDTLIMTPQDYTSELTALTNKMKEHKIPNLWLINFKRFHYIIPPKQQIWHREQVFQQLFDKGSYYFALIRSGSFINCLAIRQMFDEANELALKTSFFTDERKAHQWLMNQV